ncbi:MAG: 2-oxoisovalerate dehydrogenase [Verrucomicrobiota bacterium]|jgi:predicted RNase H-like HicB family nuclease
MRIRFEVAACEETGGYVARWDDPEGGGITTQGDTFAELDSMVRDAVQGYFADRRMPREVQLHFNEDPLLALS